MFPNLEKEQARKMQTNEDVAKILGISRQLYESKKKTGKFKLTEIKILCDFYKCNFEHLFAIREEDLPSTG